MHMLTLFAAYLPQATFDIALQFTWIRRPSSAEHPVLVSNELNNAGLPREEHLRPRPEPA